MFTRMRFHCLLVMALVGVSLAAPAAAQFGEAAGFSEMMSPYYLRRDLQFIEDRLDLDDGQAVILESLYFDYEDEHDAGKTRMIERLQQMRDEIKDMPRDEVLNLVFQPFEDRWTEWNDLRDHFLESLRAILGSEQLQRWMTFRQELRRAKELPRGQFSGESLDLIQLAEEMKFDKMVRQQIAPVLDEYAAQLDAALVARERLFQESRLAMMHSMRDDSPEIGLPIHEKEILARLAIRQVNDTFIETIAVSLPETLGPQFREKALARGYGRVFRTTAAARLFEDALRIEGLDSDRAEAVSELWVNYQEEIAPINMTILNLVREYEPEDQRFRARSFALRSGGARPEKPRDPSRDHYKHRDQIGVTYVNLLRDSLTPEQFRSLKGSRRFLKKNASVSDEDVIGPNEAERRRRAAEAAGRDDDENDSEE